MIGHFKGHVDMFWNLPTLAVVRGSREVGEADLCLCPSNLDGMGS